jgi:type IV fimbrial biogenesis protein FimT
MRIMASGRPRRATRTRHQGFSMTELVVVMLIVGIIAAIGTPSLKYVTTSNRIASEINALVGDLQYARSLAIKEGVPVTVCASASATQCDAGNNWQNGWIVFLDSSTGGTPGVVDAGEAIVRVQTAFSPPGDTLIPLGGANLNAVRFNRMGYGGLLGNPGGVTLALHDSTNTSQWTRCVEFSTVAMLTVETAGQSNCI